MSDLPGIMKKIQVEEVRFRSPLSESTAQKMGSTMNFLIDHYPVMPGTVHDFAGPETNLPPGYIVCDGRAVSRTTYDQLFAAIGIAWGQGDGLTTFNVPDLRGIFTRMVNTTTLGSSGRDPNAGTRVQSGSGGNSGDNVGSYQSDQFASHEHGYGGTGGSGGIGSTYNVEDSFSAYAFNSESKGGAETRPKNAYILKIIKT